MKLIALYLLCLTGVVQVTVSVPLAPVLIKKNMTWADAQSYCRGKYFDLATAKTATDWLIINYTLAYYNVPGPVWFGLYNDFYSWRWSLDNIPLKNQTLTKWGSGEPNNYVGHESCGAIDGNGVWWDTSCSGPKPFICYDATGPSQYVGVTTSLNWTDSQSYCRQHYTDMASSLNSTENSLLQQVTAVQGYSWFGLFRDTWKWVDETKVDPLLWKSPLPDNTPPQENCGTLNGGLLVDKQCLNQYYFICDGIPLMKYVVKVQVKADNSVFNPAVQSAILEQVKQKLDSSATVSWRIQPDGNIFQKKNCCN